MGVLNLTPDSFHDGGRYLIEKEYVSRAGQLLEEGADLLDLGGQSTRPVKLIDSEVEWQRIDKAIKQILSAFPEAILSVDTFYSVVAERAVENGVAIVNDISGGNMDENMLAVIGRLQTPYILMHMKGSPENMQENPEYSDVVDEVFDYFTEKIALLKTFGIHDIILDPGFGFGKSIAHNYSLLANLSLFRIIGFPLLAGISRKSMITKVLNIRNAEALNGTTVLNTMALLQGANILRVHDVKETVETLKLVNEYLRVSSVRENRIFIYFGVLRSTQSSE